MKKGFTLLELLVVMAILGVLLAMLFPALGRTKEGPRRVQCLNNLRQHGMAWHLYLADHDSHFPAWGVAPSSGGAGDNYTCGGKQGDRYDSNYGAQYRALNNYLDIDNESSPTLDVFHCPDDTKPNAVAGDKTSFDDRGTSYEANGKILTYGATIPKPPRPFFTITSPHDKVFLEICNPQNMPGHSGRGAADFPRVPVMVLFVDGHAAGPFLALDDFDIFTSDPSKKVLWDPNGTASSLD